MQLRDEPKMTKILGFSLTAAGSRLALRDPGGWAAQRNRIT